MPRLILITLFILICWRFADWKNWKSYYPTVLFLVICNLLGDIVFGNQLFWQYNGLVNHTFSDLLITFTIFPCMALLYLSYFPERRFRQVIYYLGWVFFSFFLEFTMQTMGYISYNSGWNLWWSFFFNFPWFFLLRLHYLRPLLAWFVVLLEITTFMLIFDVSFKSLK